MSASLDRILDRTALRGMAGGRSFDRGEDYFEHGQVGSLVEHQGVVAAKVHGSGEYRVKLWSERGQIGYSCSCPVGDDGEFCKHCVAVGLAWIAERKPSRPAKKATRRAVTMEDVRAHLAQRDKGALVDLLVKQALEDDRLREQLLLEVAKCGPRGLDVATYRAVIDRAVDAGQFVDYRSMHAYTGEIDGVIDRIEELLKEGHAAQVVELAEHALERVEEAMGSVDDSDGHMGSLLQRLQELHHAACRKAKPNPTELAERLFEWEVTTGYDTFYGAASTYADVLGKAGLAVYRRLAEAEWAKVPALTACQQGADRYGKRFRITHIMETLAQIDGDVGALVAVKSRDLSLPYAYLSIAEIYRDAKQPDRALEWAERGLRAFPERTDSRLRVFLANEYHRRKRHEEAMALVWADFAERASLEQYRQLKEHAHRTGAWPSWRARALAHVREDVAKAKARARGESWFGRADHSELVRIFLWEKDTDAAWSEASKGGCTNELWMELAKRREKSHPADALSVYEKQIQPTVSRMGNGAYAEAVKLLGKVRDLMKGLGQEAEWPAYLAAVRATHKAKRNFMKLLDRAKWT
jgi:uncharacterized Zn finger protein